MTKINKNSAPGLRKVLRASGAALAGTLLVTGCTNTHETGHSKDQKAEIEQTVKPQAEKVAEFVLNDARPKHTDKYYDGQALTIVVDSTPNGGLHYSAEVTFDAGKNDIVKPDDVTSVYLKRWINYEQNPDKARITESVRINQNGDFVHDDNYWFISLLNYGASSSESDDIFITNIPRGSYGDEDAAFDSVESSMQLIIDTIDSDYLPGLMETK